MQILVILTQKPDGNLFQSGDVLERYLSDVRAELINGNTSVKSPNPSGFDRVHIISK